MPLCREQPARRGLKILYPQKSTGHSSCWTRRRTIGGSSNAAPIELSKWSRIYGRRGGTPVCPADQMGRVRGSKGGGLGGAASCSNAPESGPNEQSAHKHQSRHGLNFK